MSKKSNFHLCLLTGYIKNDFYIDNKQVTNILLIADKDEINAIAFKQ